MCGVVAAKSQGKVACRPLLPVCVCAERVAGGMGVGVVAAWKCRGREQAQSHGAGGGHCHPHAATCEGNGGLSELMKTYTWEAEIGIQMKKVPTSGLLGINKWPQGGGMLLLPLRGGREETGKTSVGAAAKSIWKERKTELPCLAQVFMQCCHMSVCPPTHHHHRSKLPSQRERGRL